ncbi:MAG: helix-turn-helix transcriptional regulator [Christensenella sp.]|uniref:helix-turn-helix domain-containing protein n=1 Tax=Christensenella sp. TaxID=1935934 RepID=UPI002B1F812E|nr:helix-turn-helix transcriptional regulator [Christensenella sp.]MEA5003815.1 helix-turn-helix transcriptional regulator [Christensenella sp.]
MFIERLNELLKEKGVSAHKMSLELGLGKNAYTHWRDRGNLPSGDVLDKIADYFEVSTDYLLGRTENPSPINEVAAAHFKNDVDFSDLSEEDKEAVRGVIDALRAKHKK